MKLLLDTCCIIWAVSEPATISKNASVLLTADESEIYISVISEAELACAVERRRIIIDRHWKIWFRYYIELNHWQVEKVSLEIIEEAYSLPDAFHADPADRIITATARLKGYTVLTADKKNSCLSSRQIRLVVSQFIYRSSLALSSHSSEILPVLSVKALETVKYTPLFSL